MASPTVDYIVDRLRCRLRLLVRTHGLARRELVRVQQGIARLDRAGVAPSSHDFWAWTAQPRAQVLIDRAGEAIDDELAILVADIGFGALIDRPGSDDRPDPVRHRLRRRPPTMALDHVPDPALDPRLDLDLAGRVLPILPRSDDLDQLGWWWQRRLRRAAMVRALPEVLAGTTADIGLTVSRTEMQLLDRAPWAHGDRLLSAFELAYAEIERLGTTRVHQAQDRLALASGGRLALRL
ncbi:MAG: hypothetical protein AAFN30_00730 [Actinomycetota bacterium]